MPRRFRRKYWGLPNCADQEYAERAYEFLILNSKFLIPSGPLALLRRGLFGGDRLGGPLLPRAHRVQTLFERVHQVHDLRRRARRSGGDDLLARDLRVDDLLQPLAVLVAVVREIERLLEGRDHVAPFLELVALDDLRVRHLAVALRAPALLLDARLTFAVQLVERDRAARLGGREHLDRDVHQADLEEAFPGRSCCHISPLSVRRGNGLGAGGWPATSPLADPAPCP